MAPTLILAAFGLLGLFIWRILRGSASPLEKLRGPPASSWLAGHLRELSARDAFGFYDMLNAAYGAVAKIKGPMGMTWLYTWDPAAVYSILAKDLASFDEHEEIILGMQFFLGPGLIGILGEPHKKQRKMLHPLFSKKHIRDLTPIFYEVSHRLASALSKMVKDGPRELDVLSWLGRTSLELIGTAGIGYSFDPLVEGTKANPFATAVKNYIPLYSSTENVFYRQLIVFANRYGVPSVARWIAEHSPQRTIRELCAISRTLHDKSVEIIEQKRAALRAGESDVGKDIMTILLKANSAASKEDQLPDDQLIAQISTLVFAATDTTSNTLARVLHVLGERPDVQSKLREEIITACDGNDLTYDALQALPYLDAVVKETLRFYTTGPTNHRQAYRDTTLPLSTPTRGTDGKLMSSVPVPKGTIVVISLSSCNRNKALWGPDADEWKPERWLAPEGLTRALVEEPIPSAYSHLMTFLGGPRACIGFQFALLELKVVLSVLLANLTFELSADKAVYWNQAGVVYPTNGKESTDPELWLKVGRYRGNDKH
ncbi:cytochrome P450 [Trametes punicea]|nr:cytochrome P450 [Trametes punicea]